MGCGLGRSSSGSNNTRKKTQNLSIEPRMFLSKNKGRLSDDYVFIRNLGSGAFADVKLYLYKPTNQTRAVKIIHKVGLHQQQMDAEYMLKEISVLTSLDHPNILRCYEIFEDLWRFYVVIEYCAGGELFSKLVLMSKFTEAQASEIMFQLLSAVAYCHERLVIHRDLKPENILLEENEGSLKIKVADFGSSCFIDPQKHLSGCFGSAYYVAPEVLMDEYNEKCDIWSLGVIMFILLTGQPPYPGKDSKAILQMIRDSPLAISESRIPGVGASAIDLLRKILTIDPKLRINAKTALNHEWIRQHREIDAAADLSNTLKILEAFHSTAKLKDAIHIFLATQVISHEECKMLTENFVKLDKNADGKISKDELVSEYVETFEEKDAKNRVEQIIQRVDVNLNGDIDYSEFLSACMNYANYLSKENLEAAFKLFDLDNSGFITADELKEVFGDVNTFGDGVWKEVLKQVDLNGDGVIDMKEFIALMTNNVN